MDYYCKVCEAEVFVSAAGIIQRNCEHKDATVIAERTSTLFGEGGATEATLYERARVALFRLFEAFK